MEYRTLGKTDLSVSSIGLGCVTFGREIDADTALGVMDHAVEKGITLFDTAEAYAAGTSETVVGEWVKSRGSRDQIVLATKVAGTLTKDRILKSVDESLKRLNVDAVDLFQTHNWSDDAPFDETMEALNILVEQGKTRYVGCSNYEASHVEQSLSLSLNNGTARLESVQPNYNLVTRDIEAKLMPICERETIGVISYSPLGAGFLTGKYRKDGPIPEGTRFDVIPDHQDIYFSDDNFRKVEALRGISEETGRSIIELALAWVIGQPGVTSVLVGARHTSHIDQAFEAEATGLSDELRDRMSNL